MMTASMAFAQQQSVQGTVIDLHTGEPVIGASVRVEGTTMGVATDINGQFKFSGVPSTAKRLLITYMGMKDATVAIKPRVKVLMEPKTLAVDEVFVVAYGTATKESFTGSATVIKAEEIGQEQSTNVLDALNGKSAGVQMFNTSGQPGQSSPTIRIRGISSINAGNAPLIILDGAPYDGDLNTINSQDIESMTVLKDAASNALYGARGANGVIMITTKKAKAGENAKITFDAKWGSNMRASQRYKTIDDPRHYYETYYKALNNYFLDKGYSQADAYAMANDNLTAQNGYGLYYNVFNVPEGQYMIGRDGKFNPNATMGNLVNYNGQNYYLTADDWFDEAYKTGFRQEYNVTATHVSGPSSFYASFGYLDNEGITANSNYERITGRLKADSQLKSWLKVGANMSYTHYEANQLDEDGVSNSSGNVFAAATQVAPIYPLFIRDANGNVMVDAYGNTRYDYGDKENAGLERPVYTSTNALSDAILNTSAYEGNALNAVGFAEFRFLKDFKFTSTNTVNLDESRSTGITNGFYGSYADSEGIVSKTHGRTLSFDYQQVLDWSHLFGNHEVSIMLGHDYYRRKYYNLYGNKSGMFDPNNKELAGAITVKSADSYTTDYNSEGYFGRAQWNYEEKYFASASFRRDASSRFHKDHRWGSFWSAGGAWLINKESWFNLDFVDMLKIKASYGEQGNDNIGNYLYTNTYTIDNSSYHASVVPNSMGNDVISWEKNGNFNAGIDFELFRGRLSGSFEYFYRTTRDMLSWVPTPLSYGWTGYYSNIGNMRNSGIEFDIRYDIIKNEDMNWNVNLNLTHYKNKITKLDEARKTITIDGVEGYESGSYFFGEGAPLYTYSMKQYAGVDKETGLSMWYTNKKVEVLDAEGNPVLDANGNKITKIEKQKTTDYSEASNYLCGTALPDLYGGFGTTFTWKGFDLSMDFAYQIGGQVYDGDYASAMSSPISNSKGSAIHADILKAWTPDNKDSNIPRFQYGDNYTAPTSDRFLTDASFLSLRNINLGYTLPAHITRPAGIGGLRVYVSADNVWYWSKRQGLDPRQGIGSATSSYYSPIRTISGGISVTF